MAQFSKFKFLFALKLIFNGGSISRNIKIWLFQKVEKSEKLHNLQKLNICVGKLIKNEHWATMLNELVSALLYL